MLCGSLDGRGLWERMGTCICMAKPLHCSTENITTWLIGYTPYEINFFFFLNHTGAYPGAQVHRCTYGRSRSTLFCHTKYYKMRTQVAKFNTITSYIKGNQIKWAFLKLQVHSNRKHSERPVVLLTTAFAPSLQMSTQWKRQIMSRCLLWKLSDLTVPWHGFEKPWGHHRPHSENC